MKVSLFLVAFGFALFTLGAGVCSVVEARRFRRRAWRTMATVVGFHTEWVNVSPSSGAAPDSDRSLIHWPILAFHDEAGVRREEQAHLGYGSHRYKIGDRVPILYSPDHRRRVLIDSFLSLHLSACAFFGIAAFGIVLAIIPLLM
jgi:hypothetical protein